MIVVDASAVVDSLITGTPLTGSMVAPDYLFVECASALARLARQELLDDAVASNAAAVLTDLPITLISTRTLLSVAWSLRDAVSVADSFYVACAIVGGGSLLTSDQRLARGARSLGVEVSTPRSR